MSLLGLSCYLPTRRWRGSRACGPRTAARTSYRDKEQRSYHAWSQGRAPPASPGTGYTTNSTEPARP